MKPRKVTKTVVIVAGYAHEIGTMEHSMNPWHVLEPLRRVCSPLVKPAVLCHIAQMVVGLHSALATETFVEMEILLLSMTPCRLHYAFRHG